MTGIFFITRMYILNKYYISSNTFSHSFYRIEILYKIFTKHVIYLKIYYYMLFIQMKNPSKYIKKEHLIRYDLLFYTTYFGRIFRYLYFSLVNSIKVI